VPFRTRRLDVEADPVVAKDHLDLVALLLDRDPDVRRLRVLEGVHHTLACVVVQQQCDRRGHVHLVDIGVESNVGFARHLDEEPADRLSQTRPPEGRPVQVSDQGPDAIGRSVLRLLDLEEQFLRLIDLPRIEMPSSHVDLDREPEQELSKVVVKERSDLHALVLTFLRHAVRQCTKYVLAIL